MNDYVQIYDSEMDYLHAKNHHGTITKEQHARFLELIKEASDQRKHGKFQYLEIIKSSDGLSCEFVDLTGWSDAIRWRNKNDKFNHQIKGSDYIYFVQSPYNRKVTIRLVVAWHNHKHDLAPTQIRTFHFDEDVTYGGEK